MSEGLHVVFGANGPVGLSLVERLTAAGRRVRAVHRSGDMPAPESVEVVACDAADRRSATLAAEGAEVVYGCIGVDYTQWPALWPPIVEGLLAATEAAGARLVFADNLYAQGPVDGPLREEPVPPEPMTHGKKPALRARMASLMLAAHSSGRCPVALVRASDFYGPRVLNAALGDRVFPAILAGKSAQLLPGVDHLHSYTYVPDLARALDDVGADSSAFGRVWHVPNAPARTTREVVREAIRLAGTSAKVSVMPRFMLSALGLFVPMLRELKELGFIWDRDYVVEDAAFREHFGWTATSLDEGLRATLDWYGARA